MRAERAIALALLASMVASAGLLLIYVADLGGPQVEGILLAVALGGVGTAIVVWAIALLSGPLEAVERHPLASSPEQRESAEAALDIETITRRRFLVRLLAGAGSFLAVALALPAFSLGPQPGRDLFVTAWRHGVRVVGENGQPIRPDEMAPDSVRTVFPEGSLGRPDSQTMLIRLRPGDLQLAADRAAWAPDDCVGYSKVCTHAGCPVGLYRAQDKVLICPCHQSTFDVRRGATPVFGPAARPLPQLPMELDADGYLVATGDFPEPIGPSFWNITHQPPEGSGP
jgi:ubiquinol-cytochrome c reductase iron-sulfur subunit